MQIKDTPQHYGWIAILFHWLMALLIIGMLTVGLYMTDLPNNLQKLKLYGLHKEFGILILTLVILRIIWRVFNIKPPYPVMMPNWEKMSATTAHIALYGFMIAMPLTGWLISSTAGIPVSFFGLFVLPDLIGPNTSLKETFQFTHMWLAYFLIATLCLHILAALKHHFINKDHTLRRIL